jgi:hypothetical protein
MSSFIDANDYRPYITDRRKSQIIEQDPAILDVVESAAIQRVRDCLYPKYDVDTIFATSGASRPAQVLRWVVIIAVFYIYERIPDLQKPESIKLSYENVLKELEEIEQAKKSLELPRSNNSEGEAKTKFRWGSQPPRGHSTNLG